MYNFENTYLSDTDFDYLNSNKKEFVKTVLPIIINENQKIAPINPYAATKAFQDLISQIYHKSFGLKIIITRAVIVHITTVSINGSNKATSPSEAG